jgi:hypothetical protein
MLTLREEQKLALLEEAHPRLLDTRMRKLCATVARIYPEVCEELSEAEIRSWVEHGIAVAQEHEFELFESQARYVHLTFLAGDRNLESSDVHPWVSKILAWADSDEGLRLTALETRADKELNG